MAIKRQPGESIEEYVVRTNPTEYGQKPNSQTVQNLNQQAQTLQSRGGYWDASQEARNRAVYGDSYVEQKKAEVAAAGGGTNPEQYIATDASGNQRIISQAEASQIMAQQLRPKIRTAENQQMAQSRGLEAPGLAWAAEDGNNLGQRNIDATPTTITTKPPITSSSIESNDTQRYKKMYKGANPAQKVGLHAATLFSTKGRKYIGSLLPGGLSPEEVVEERIALANKQITDKSLSAGDILFPQMTGNPVTTAASFYPVAAGLNTGARLVGLGVAAATRSIPIGLQISKGINAGLLGAGIIGMGSDYLAQPTKEEKVGTIVTYGAGLVSITGLAKKSPKGAKSARTSPFATAEAASTERINPATDTPSSRATRINEGIKDTMKNTENDRTVREQLERDILTEQHAIYMEHRKARLRKDGSKPGRRLGESIEEYIVRTNPTEYGQKPAKISGKPESPINDDPSGFRTYIRDAMNEINNVFSGGRTSRVSKPAPKASEPTPAQSPAQGAEAQINRVMQNPFLRRPQAPAGSRISRPATQARRFPVIKTPTLAELVGRTRIRQQGMRQQYLEGARKPRTISEIMKATERNIFKQTGGRRPVMLRGSGLQKGGGRNPPVPRKSSFPINPDYTPVIKIPKIIVPKIYDPFRTLVPSRKTPLEPYRGRYPEPIKERPPVRRPGSEQKMPKIKIPGVPFGGLPGFNLGLGGGYAKKANAQITTIENRMKRAIDLL